MRFGYLETIVRAPLVPAESGLLAADLSTVGDLPPVVRLTAADGTAVAGVGLDEPAPLELREPPAADLSGLVALARSPAPAGGTPLAPWLAALAVVLGVLGAVARTLARAPR